MLTSFVESLGAHRAAGGVDDQWRMQYKFLGQPVCTVALVQLMGISMWMLTQGREGALKGHRSVLYAHEIGLHACIMNQSKAHVYSSARQWLEQYAATHAEQNPMDDKAYIHSGRRSFYYFNYWRDL